MASIRCLMLDLKSYYPSPAYQLGLLACYACTEPEVKKAMEFSFLEFPRQRPAQDIAKAVLESGADLVCASNYAWNYKKICEVLDLLAASGQPVPRILLGGPNSPGTFGENMMRKYPQLSALVEGEGEPAFKDICCTLVDSPEKNPFAGARNCVYRDDSGAIVRPTNLHRIQFLDEVPSPYLTGLLPAAPSPVFYETNRGCPYRCAFCYWGNGNPKVYRMSHERVREEMEFFAKHRVSSFWIADANFGIFKEDSEIAEMMCEINARHGYPFRNVGVNWAKNSSDRVLEISSIFRSGRMSCTTTLAVQSVTKEAEEKSKRYSMAPAKFANLITLAQERQIDTYTDMIWGLPGENVEEYVNGLDAVVTTGVPSILIHQLYLLPGTEFFEKRDELGIKMVCDAGGTTVEASERSDYWDYIVVSHPKMSVPEMQHGTRIIGVNHMLHNHDLGRVVNFYLARYGISPADVYNFMDEVIVGRVDSFDSPFLTAIRNLILEFSTRTGLDEFMFYRRLSDLIWFKKDQGEKGKIVDYGYREALSFMTAFYHRLIAEKGIKLEPWEAQLLDEMVHYNVLLSPKPVWQPQPGYHFQFDVHGIWNDMQALIYQHEDLAVEKEKAEEDRETWPQRARRVRSRVASFLSDEYLLSHRQPSQYTVHNPWLIVPSQDNSDWLLSTRSKHCVVKPASPAQVAPGVGQSSSVEKHSSPALAG
jgi:radical SAM superfamily enzyme YgiQ (UPF0313 family)